MITLQFLPFPSYSGDSDKGKSHLILLQCPSPKGGVCIRYQKVINVLWYNRVKRRRGKSPSWFQYALLISQSHCHKNASTSIENRNTISTIQLWNLIWPKRGLGDFSTLSGKHRVMCINTNIPGNFAMYQMLCGNKDGEVFIVVVILDMGCGFCSWKTMANFMAIFEFLFICEDPDRVEFEHTSPLPLCY